jgi:hypothetical protein
MSGGGGGPVIIGEKDLATEVLDNLDKVAPFRRQRASDIISAYQANENSITREQQQFLLRCAADIVDNI